MAKFLINYNFDSELADEIKGDFDLLYRIKLRNSCFAAAWQENEDEIIALRDHLGIAPLYFRFDSEEGFKIDTALSRLIKKADTLSLKGAQKFIAHKTSAFYSLVEGINIVPAGTVLKINLRKKIFEPIYHFEFEQKPYLELSCEKIVNAFDGLMSQAVSRILKSKEVGLYLSGGMDSGLVGIYLKKAGAKVNGYTLAPWGIAGSEVAYAKQNAEAIGLNNFSILPLETEKYESLVKNLPDVFGSPIGLNNAIGVSALWQETGIGSEKQIFGAQNADTMLCSMPHQYYVYFLSWLPAFVKRRIHSSFSHSDMLADYIDYCTHGLVGHARSFSDFYSDKNLSKIFFLTMAGMYIGHTPPDGAVLADPAISRNISYGNPFYDIDLIEWSLRVPFKYRVGFSHESRLGISLSKTVLRKLAERYLPKKLVWRKKGFVVPMQRDEKTKRFSDSLPDVFTGVNLKKTDEKLAAFILETWCNHFGIKKYDY